MSHFGVQQRLAQHCKSTILQFKKPPILSKLILFLYNKRICIQVVFLFAFNTYWFKFISLIFLDFRKGSIYMA